MKKLLALSITAALASTSALADTAIYGKINLSLQSLEETGPTGATAKENWEVISNASRIGFKGDTRINDNLKAIYKLEYEVSVDEGAFSSDKDVKNGSATVGKVKVDNEFKSRNIYVGLQGNWGTLIAGKHDTPSKQVQGEVDRFNDLTYADLKNVLVGENRENDFIQYSLPELASVPGLNAAIAVIPGEDSGADGTTDQDDGAVDKYSLGVTYQGDVLYLGLGYDNNVQNTNLLRLVTDITLGDVKLGALWQKADAHDSGDIVGKVEGIVSATGLRSFDAQKGYLLSAAWKIGKATLKAQYQTSESDAIVAATGARASQNDVEAKGYALGVDYKLAKATTLFAYVAQLESSANSLIDDPEYKTFGIGLDHRF